MGELLFHITLLLMFPFPKIGQWRASLMPVMMMKTVHVGTNTQVGPHERGSREQSGGTCCLEDSGRGLGNQMGKGNVCKSLIDSFPIFMMSQEEELYLCAASAIIFFLLCYLRILEQTLPCTALQSSSPVIDQAQGRASGSRARGSPEEEFRNEDKMGPWVGLQNPQSSRTLGSHLNSNSPLSFPMVTLTSLPSLST